MSDLSSPFYAFLVELTMKFSNTEAQSVPANECTEFIPRALQDRINSSMSKPACQTSCPSGRRLSSVSVALLTWMGY